VEEYFPDEKYENIAPVLVGSTPFGDQNNGDMNNGDKTIMGTVFMATFLA
jgi:hypothetical protein